MPAWTRRIPFKVDVAGIIEIMGSSLYSRVDTPIRELVQNAHDGIMRRRQIDLRHQGRIDIEQDAQAGTLTVHDDGIGLNAEEAEAYLGTLGIGITGLIKRQLTADDGPIAGDPGSLIGQFGVGLFSAFLLAEKLIVTSRRVDATESIRWEAGAGSDITLSSDNRASIGTSVTLVLKPERRAFAVDAELLERSIRDYADFLPLPIYVNRQRTRTNVIHASWFEATPEPEQVELELESCFEETPLDIIPIRIERPIPMSGALYVTPQRTPGFSNSATVAVTVRRMVISRKVQDLIPDWASFLRGVLELQTLSPTASREDLVRDTRFQVAHDTIERLVFEHFERLAEHDPRRLQSIVTWHRYSLAGAALGQPRLRTLLKKVYRFPTSQGQLSFAEILERSPADSLFENDADAVIWYNVDRRQEGAVESLFRGYAIPCVHALLSFEESLLGAMASDCAADGVTVDLRLASPASNGFAEQVLGVREIEDAPEEWKQFLSALNARIQCASFDEQRPVLAFLNERSELFRTMEELKKGGTIPAGFQRLIDNHMQGAAPAQNEVLLNRAHRLVSRALAQSTRNPLASVLRLLVISTLSQAGAVLDRSAQQQQMDDLDWIAETLGGKQP